MTLATFFKAYKQFRLAIIADRKQREVDELSAHPLNYGILRDLINSAKAGVLIEVKTKDGVTLTIRPDEAFDKSNLRKFVEDF